MPFIRRDRAPSEVVSGMLAVVSVTLTVAPGTNTSPRSLQSCRSTAAQ